MYLESTSIQCRQGDMEYKQVLELFICPPSCRIHLILERRQTFVKTRCHLVYRATDIQHALYFLPVMIGWILNTRYKWCSLGGRPVLKGMQASQTNGALESILNQIFSRVENTAETAHDLPKFLVIDLLCLVYV